MDIKKNPNLNLKSTFKNFLHFRRELGKSKKQTKKSSVKQFIISCDVLRIFTAVNQRVNSCEAKYNTDILLIITASQMRTQRTIEGIRRGAEGLLYFPLR